MFRWASGLLAAGGLVAATAGVAVGDGAVTTAPVAAMTLRATPLDLPISSLDGTISIHRARVTLQSDVLFRFDSSRLSRRAEARLREVAHELDRRRPRTIHVEGHTDNRGSAIYNMRLSQRRAVSVRDALGVSLAGHGASIRAFGRGETEPVAPNASRLGRARNRRVEIRFR
jgi:outer membrane protein OmpA-like peptidoglycan-associated protein